MLSVWKRWHTLLWTNRSKCLSRPARQRKQWDAQRRKITVTLHCSPFGFQSLFNGYFSVLMVCSRCLWALIAFPFVFVIVSCHWLLSLLATFASLVNQLKNDTLYRRHSKTVHCINWWREQSSNVIKWVRAFKIYIKMTNVVQIQRKSFST